MRYTFLTSLVPREWEERIKACSKNTLWESSSNLGWSLYEGMAEKLHERLTIYNVLPVGSYPQYYTKMFIPAHTFATRWRNDHRGIGFCNLKGLRKLLLPQAIYRALEKRFRGSTQEEWLIVYSVCREYMQAAGRLKKRFPGLHICAVVADLPEMSNLSGKKSGLLVRFEQYRTRVSYQNLACVDKFVLLTKYMADRLGQDKPYCVMEGIAADGGTPDEAPEKPAVNTVVYTGTLHKCFGVMNLVEAFENIPDANYRLIICGVGDADAELRQAAERDSRIRYCGKVSHAEAVALQKQATVLVNPRQNNEEFVKYSFPSKLMEYLSRGIPVVAHKLDGMPDEYDEYICCVEDDSAAALTRKIVEVCGWDAETWRAFGRRGQEFVRREKNPAKQGEKILNFIGAG